MSTRIFPRAGGWAYRAHWRGKIYLGWAATRGDARYGLGLAVQDVYRRAT